MCSFSLFYLRCMHHTRLHPTVHAMPHHAMYQNNRNETTLGVSCTRWTSIIYTRSSHGICEGTQEFAPVLDLD